jgi:hypothetical protein
MLNPVCHCEGWMFFPARSKLLPSLEIASSRRTLLAKTLEVYFHIRHKMIEVNLYFSSRMAFIWGYKAGGAASREQGGMM